MILAHCRKLLRDVEYRNCLELTMNANELKKKALTFIDAENSMTLATSEDDRPWAAPVYYVREGGKFYFFSGPDSRHILESKGEGRAAAAISCDTAGWQGIRGIQMSGTVSRISPGICAAKVVCAYVKKFPMTSSFFEGGAQPDLESFRQKFRVRLYRFAPDLVYYLDNAIGFGFRQRVFLED